MMSQNIQNPIFILGVQRAGTTLINQLLSSNDELKTLERETHLYILLWNFSNKLPFENNKELANFLYKNLPKINKGWTNESSLKTLKGITETLKDKKEAITTVDELMSFFLDYQGGKYPNILTGEKTPGHIFYLSLLIKRFPKARFIIMVRDPRACYLSENTKLVNAHAKPLNITTFINRWASVSFLARYYLKKYPRQVQVYRYEDLILRPEIKLKLACNFLDIDFDDKMLEARVTNSSFQDGNQTDKSFNSENIERWKGLLSPNDIKLIESTLGEEMKRWKYSFFFPKKVVSPLFFKTLGLKFMLGLTYLACRIHAPLFHHLNRNKRYKSFNN